MDVLGRGLAALHPHRAEQAAKCVAALAAGYADAERAALFSQQESLHLSLLTAVREAEGNLRASEARFDEVATASASGIVITDQDGRLTRVNAAMCAMLERSADDLAGRSLFDFVHPEHADSLRSDYSALLAGRTQRVRKPGQLLREDGDYARVTLSAAKLRDAQGRPSHVVTVVEDGTELALLRGELSRQALHDVLTGLPNRQYYTSHLEGALRGPRGVTVLHLGLDGLDAVAHGFGRHAADQVLVTVARRLTAVADGAMVARLDGAEFAVLRENTALSSPTSALVSAVLGALRESVWLGAASVAVGASVGVVDRPEAAARAADVLRAADHALRRARVRGGVAHYRADLDSADRGADALAATMAEAVESGQVGVGYRAVRSLADDGLVGVEGRLSWAHPTGETVGHDRCVGLAERTGLPLVGLLLQTAATRLRWRREVPVLVPLSEHQTRDPDLPTQVEAALSTGVDPAALHVGVRARALPDGTATALSGLGVPVVLDGFTLGDLPLLEGPAVSAVRVDPTLAGRHTSLMAAALAPLPRLAHAAGARLIVDGVTTPEDAAWWRAAGADEATGEYVGPGI